MGQLEDMSMFVAVVEAGSISKAAEQLDIAKSAVSRRLNELEKRLATLLINRTTRRSHLTSEGQAYYQRALTIIEEVNALNEETSGKKACVEGTLKISAPLTFGLLHMKDVFDTFAKQYPELSFQIDFSDRKVDLIEEGFEMAIRIGTLEDSTYQAKCFTTIHHNICASPAYLKKYGTPKKPEDLSSHNCLQYQSGNIVLTDKAGIAHSVKITAQMKANNGEFLKAMAISGQGITLLPTFITYEAVASKQLIPILTNYEVLPMSAYAIYPRNRFLSARCRLFIDFISKHFGDTPYWDK